MTFNIHSCPHNIEGWCAQCVAALKTQADTLREALKPLEKIRRFADLNFVPNWRKEWGDTLDSESATLVYDITNHALLTLQECETARLALSRYSEFELNNNPIVIDHDRHVIQHPSTGLALPNVPTKVSSDYEKPLSPG